MGSLGTELFEAGPVWGTARKIGEEAGEWRGDGGICARKRAPGGGGRGSAGVPWPGARVSRECARAREERGERERWREERARTQEERGERERWRDARAFTAVAAQRIASMCLVAREEAVP